MKFKLFILLPCLLFSFIFAGKSEFEIPQNDGGCKPFRPAIVATPKMPSNIKRSLEALRKRKKHSPHRKIWTGRSYEQLPVYSQSELDLMRALDPEMKKLIAQRNEMITTERSKQKSRQIARNEFYHRGFFTTNKFKRQ